MSWPAIRRPDSPRWVALAVGSALLLAVPMLTVEVHSLVAHVGRAGLVLLAGPLAVAAMARRRIGWQVDRLAIRNALVLTAAIVPIYVVGSVLPSIRSFYPLWSPDPSPLAFLPYAAALGVIILATETYYRGLLCVGIADIGPVCILVSPVLYTIWHLGHPPIELLLSAPADILFGAVDYRSDSILPSVTAHTVGFVTLMWLVSRPPIVPQEPILELFSWLPVVSV